MEHIPSLTICRKLYKKSMLDTCISKMISEIAALAEEMNILITVTEGEDIGRDIKKQHRNILKVIIKIGEVSSQFFFFIFFLFKHSWNISHIVQPTSHLGSAASLQSVSQ